MPVEPTSTDLKLHVTVVKRASRNVPAHDGSRLRSETWNVLLLRCLLSGLHGLCTAAPDVPLHPVSAGLSSLSLEKLQYRGGRRAFFPEGGYRRLCWDQPTYVARHVSTCRFQASKGALTVGAL